jgi:hypothetical protein
MIKELQICLTKEMAFPLCSGTIALNFYSMNYIRKIFIIVLASAGIRLDKLTNGRIDAILLVMPLICLFQNMSLFL